MREKKDYVVITFHTTAEAMAMEEYCSRQAVRGRLIPVPREISAGCGIAWRMTEEEYASSKERLPETEYEQIVKIRM